MGTRWRRYALVSFAATAATLLSTAGLAAGPGDLDPSFNGNGRVVTAFPGGSRGQAVGFDADGRILVAVTSSTDGSDRNFSVVRYERDGTPDEAFGESGTTTLPLGGWAEARGLAVLPDGSALVSGYAFNGVDNDFAVARFTPEGHADQGFGTGGASLTQVAAGDDGGWGIAVQPDGRVLVAGSAGNGRDSDYAIVRYEPAGGLDPDFGAGGKIITAIRGAANDTGRDVAVQADGQIVVGGFTCAQSCALAVARLDPDGSPDPSFDRDGRALASFGDRDALGGAIALQEDGKIVIAGIYNQTDFAVARFNPDGSPDASFDGDGQVTTPIGLKGSADVWDVAIQPNGKLVVGGLASDGTDADFALVRYHADGSLDEGFGTHGKVVTSFGAGFDSIYGLALAPDGGIVAAGITCEADNEDACNLAVARYLGDPVEPTPGVDPTATVTPSPTPPDGSTATPTPPTPATCAGDCNGSGTVTIDELIGCVALALESPGARPCDACDPNANGAVTINELITAVGAAASGCPS